jgi:hypothetical protein
VLRQSPSPLKTKRETDRLQIGRWFNFKDRQATFTVECRAGFITFLMVSPALSNSF